MADLAEKEITKRKVTMRSVVAVPGGVQEHVATDYVRPDILDSYVADAQLRWQTVEVSEEPDAGPGGYDGATYVPDTIGHELGGVLFEATGTTPEDAAGNAAASLTKEN